MAHRLRSRRDDQGFTLIELLIVIVILGILAAIVVFAVGNTGKNSASAACKSDAKSVETALEAYKAQNNGAYPTVNDWTALTTTGAAGAPYLRAQPGTDHYTLTWDSSGNVLVGAAAGTDPAPTPQNFDTAPKACDDVAS
jgi:general secretion pathway protein G